MSGTIREDAPVSLSTWFGFAAMSFGMFMAILDIQVVATSLPEIRAALQIPPERMSWIQTAYLIAEVISIPLTGWLTRLLTMRGLFSLAVVVFTGASIGCAFSTGFYSLTFWRVIQGFAGGTLIPSVFTAVFLLFPKRREALATTIAGVVAVLAPTLGPVVGGWITQTYSWHWLFLINVIPGILSFCIGWRCLPREAARFDLMRQLDILALCGIAFSLAALEIGLKEAPQRGWLSAVSLFIFALCVAGGWFFIERTLKSAQPIVRLSLLRDRRLALGCALSFLIGIGLFGSVYLMPVFLSFVRGHGPLGIGLIMLVTGLAQLASAPLTVAAEKRIDASILTMLGFLAFSIGLGMSAFDTRETDFREMIWPQIIRGAAIMLCLLPPTRLALGHLSPETVPDGSSLFNLMRNLGGAIGIALIDTVLWTRAPEHSQALAARLAAGDRDLALAIGVPAAFLKGPLPSADDPNVRAFLKPLLEKAGLVSATNEAWMLIACILLLGPILLIAAGQFRRLKAAS